MPLRRLLWLVAVLRAPPPRWSDYAATGVDVLVVVRCVWCRAVRPPALFPVFFLLPIWVAFHSRHY